MTRNRALTWGKPDGTHLVGKLLLVCPDDHSDCKFSAFAPLFALSKDDVFTLSPRNLWARVGSTAQPRRCDSNHFTSKLVRLKITKNYVFFQANVFWQTSPSDFSLETTLCKMTAKSNTISGETGWDTPRGHKHPEALRSLSGASPEPQMLAY